MQASARHWTRFAACLLVAVAMPFSTAARQSPTITNEQCEGGWTESSASGSCGFPLITGSGAWTVDTDSYSVWAYNGSCRVKVSCKLSDDQQQPTENDITVPLISMLQLENCEGELKISSC